MKMISLFVNRRVAEDRGPGVTNCPGPHWSGCGIASAPRMTMTNRAFLAGVCCRMHYTVGAAREPGRWHLAGPGRARLHDHRRRFASVDCFEA
jgi:hypothetical protein